MFFGDYGLMCFFTGMLFVCSFIHSLEQTVKIRGTTNALFLPM